MASPLYPSVKVKLTGEDGNAYFIIGRCVKAARKANVDAAVIDEFSAKVMSGDYDQLLQTCMMYWDCR